MESIKEKLVKKALSSTNEQEQIMLIRTMSKKLSTTKLKQAYRKLKHSKKHADIMARDAIANELHNRGIRI